MKVLIADDDGLIRESLKILLEIEDDISVVGTASTGQEAFEMCLKEKPDVVLMDIRMPVMDGVLGTKLIKEHFKDDEYIKEAVKNGAEGYILKNQSSDSIIETLRAVDKGHSVFQKEVADILTSLIKEDRKKDNSQYDMSEKELELLKLVSDGLSNREIAAKLFLSEGTVRNYITILLDKLQMRDRTQLAIFYLKNF